MQTGSEKVVENLVKQKRMCDCWKNKRLWEEQMGPGTESAHIFITELHKEVYACSFFVDGSFQFVN